jgi:hypothetical protein
VHRADLPKRSRVASPEESYPLGRCLPEPADRQTLHDRRERLRRSGVRDGRNAAAHRRVSQARSAVLDAIGDGKLADIFDSRDNPDRLETIKVLDLEWIGAASSSDADLSVRVRVIESGNAIAGARVVSRERAFLRLPRERKDMVLRRTYRRNCRTRRTGTYPFTETIRASVRSQELVARPSVALGIFCEYFSAFEAPPSGNRQ